jgi:hypothetical protein
MGVRVELRLHDPKQAEEPTRALLIGQTLSCRQDDFISTQRVLGGSELAYPEQL